MSKQPHAPITSWHRAATVMALLGGMAAAGGLTPDAARADDARSAAAPLGQQPPGDVSSAPSSSAASKADRRKLKETRQHEFGSILAPLMSSPDHLRLAARVDALVRRNAADQARQVLAEAIQAGTFAALMIDRLEDPELLAFLDSVERPKDAVPDPDDRDTRIRELDAALTYEKDRADAAQRELAERGADLVTLEARLDSKAAALRAAEARIQDQAAAAARDGETQQSELERLRHEQAQRLSEESARTAAAQTERDELRQRLASLRGADARIADLSDALAAERTRADAASQSLSEQRRAADNLQARLADGLASLRQEKARADAAASEADRLRTRVDDAERAAQGSEQAETALRGETERATGLAAEVDRLRKQLETAMQGAQRSEQAETALRGETERATGLAAEVDRLRKQLETAMQGAQRSEQAETALRGETERATGLAAEVDRLRKQLETAMQAARRSEQAETALRGETERAAALAGEANQLRDQLARLQEEAASGAEARSALERERQDRAAAAAGLEQIKRENSALAEKVARLEAVSEELAKEKQRTDELAGELTALRVSAAKVERNASGAETTGAVAGALDPELDPAGRRLNVRLPAFLSAFRGETMQLSPADHGAAGEDKPSATAPAREARDTSAIERNRKLVERAEGLLKTRDIAGARLLLERAARSGDGRANYLLAQSYDPAVLAQWQVVGGVSGDEAKARAYYAAARASGYR